MRLVELRCKSCGALLKPVGGLTDTEQVLYIEQQLEQFLGIQDKPMPGELPR